MVQVREEEICRPCGISQPVVAYAGERTASSCGQEKATLSKVDACSIRTELGKRNDFFSKKGPHVKYRVMVYQTSFCISASIYELKEAAQRDCQKRSAELPSFSLVCLLSQERGDCTKALYIRWCDSARYRPPSLRHEDNTFLDHRPAAHSSVLDTDRPAG